MPEPHEIDAVGTLVAAQGLTSVLESVANACEGQARLLGRWPGLDRDSAARLARLWERCAGEVRKAAGSPAVREIKRRVTP